MNRFSTLYRTARTAVVAMLLLLLVACSVKSSSSLERGESAAPEGAAHAVEKPSNTRSPATRRVPSATSAPTRPRVTSTPAPPTNTPLPTATATPAGPPLVLTGSGDGKSEPFTPPDRFAVYELACPEDVYCHGRLMEATTDQFAGLLRPGAKVNSTRGAPPAYYVEIEADGPWSVTVKGPAHLEQSTEATLTGVGDGITPLFALEKGRVDVQLTHDAGGFVSASLVPVVGDSSYLLDGWDAYSGVGSAPAERGLYLLEVSAQGNWSATISQPTLGAEPAARLPLPATFSGTTDAVTEPIALVDETAPDNRLLIAEVSYEGDQSITVTVRDWRTGKSLTTAGGSKSGIGTHTMGLALSGLPEAGYLTVRARGPWSLTIKPASQWEQTDQLSFSGTGPMLTPLFPLKSGTVKATVSYQGSDRLNVYLHSIHGGGASLANSEGPFTSEIERSTGGALHLLEVTGDGAWTVTLEEE